MVTSSMKPRSVTGSSSSGSVTVSRQPHTSATLRSSRLRLTITSFCVRSYMMLLRCFGESHVLQLRSLRFHVDAVKPGGVESEDLAFGLRRQVDAMLLPHILGQLESPEFFDQPARRPDGVVAAEQDFVLAHPEQQF